MVMSLSGLQTRTPEAALEDERVLNVKWKYFPKNQDFGIRPR